MGFFNKLRVPSDRAGAPRGVAGGRVATAASRAGPAPTPPGGRLSNALKDFLWHLDGIEHGNLLDLGPVWQSTVSFFVQRGFKVYTEDLLGAWRDFLRVEEERLRDLPPGEDTSDVMPAVRAERFLRGTVQYPQETFDALLAWDLLDYLDKDLATRLVDRVVELLRPGGVVLALFHSRKPEGFHRYRVLDEQHLELLPASTLVQAQRTYQNREIQDLFNRFHSSKTFVGRDQLREGLFIK